MKVYCKLATMGKDEEAETFLESERFVRNRNKRTTRSGLGLSMLIVFVLLGTVLFWIGFTNIFEGRIHGDIGDAALRKKSLYSVMVVNLQQIFWELPDEDDRKENKAEIDFMSEIRVVPNTPQCLNVPDSHKFDCNPDSPITESICISRGCCWKQSTSKINRLHNENQLPPLNVPYCYYPSNYLGYSVSNVQKTATGLTAVLRLVKPSGFPNDAAFLNFNVSFYDEQRLRIKITDFNRTRYEVQVPNLSHVKIKSSFQPLYDVDLSQNGDFKVVRKSSGAVLFSSNLSTLVYADQFLQLSSLLPTQYIYGLGEHKGRLLRSVNWSRFTFFNRDRGPSLNENLYGSHPFYLALEKDSKSHGVFLFNSNSMDIILQPAPAITFRTIGGVLDFFIFMGPSPANVVRQYLQYIGLPTMPPYWGLGFHLCRYGYGTVNRTREIWQRTRTANIPFDTQWNDIDYMDKDNDFSYDHKNFKGLPDFVKEVHDAGMHYVVITDPGISNSEPPGTYPPFDDGIAADIFIKNSTGQLFIGKVWNRVSTVFPDFTNPSILSYWTKQIRRFHSSVPFDGLWIDMNEPSNFYNGQADGCPKNSSFENPPYVPGGQEPLYTKTLCMTAKQYLSEHYNVHNLYGLTETIATNIALSSTLQKRPFIISRSTFPGQGHFGSHWSGDISSTWDAMKDSLTTVMNFNMFGIPFIGADICGFNGNTTVELCARWSQLGAFYPFSRNHNSLGNIDQDPVALGPLVISAARNALLTRYSFLPYLYTLLYRSHVFGETVVRPLFFEYINDEETYSIDTQILWGSSLMYIPVLEPDVKSVIAYLPKDTWLIYPEVKIFNSPGINYTFPALYDQPNLALRCGFIIPEQLPIAPQLTTTKLRKAPFALITLLCPNGESSGELYWDDGDSLDTYSRGAFNLINFSVRNNTFQSSIVRNGYETKMELYEISVLGIEDEPTSVTVNQKPFHYVIYNPAIKNLIVYNVNVSLLDPLTITWK